MSIEGQDKQSSEQQDAFAQWLQATGQSHLLEQASPDEAGDSFAALFAQFAQTACGQAEINGYVDQVREEMGFGPEPDCDLRPVVGGVDAEEELYLRSRYDEEDLHGWAPKLDAAGRILEVIIYEGKAGADPVEDAIRKITNLRHVRKATIDFNFYEEDDTPEKPISIDALMPLAEWRRLAEIDIIFGDAPPKVLVNLSRRNPLSELRVATIKSRAGAASMMQSLRSAAQLHTINIQCHDLNDDDLRWLSGSAAITSLAIDSTRVTGAGLASLQCQDSLHSLSLEACPVSDEGLRQLCQFDQLRELTFDGAGVTDAAFSHIGDLSSLRELLCGTLPNVTAEAFNSAIARLANLEELGLWNVPFDDAIIPAIVKMPSLHSFSLLGGSRLTPAGVRELQSLRPDIRVSAYHVFSKSESADA